MKALKKNELINQDQIESTLLEKQILMDFQHPFLCSLNFCFQTFERVYFVMPFFRGGELFQQLKINRIFNEEKYNYLIVE
jgi:serum/glucocorticoid-regulated kinase 2